MSYRFKNITIKKPSLYYLVLVLVAIIIPLTTYPLIYGVDAFQLIWMANALKEGALFSDNTWLISPFSYFGYYPFSHRAIGVPMFFAFLMSLLEFLSFGVFGITEAVLMFDIILIIIIYKCSRNLGNKLFEEEWSRFVFVAAILLSPNAIQDFAMTVSTRIIITIVMLVLLNLNLKILQKGTKIQFKTTIFMILILLVGALAHRLWMNTVITIIFIIFTLLIRKYKKLHHLSVFLIIPLSIIVFFFGFEFFGLDRFGYSSDANFIDISIFLSLYYVYAVGLITLFFPFGVLITVYKLTFTFDNFNLFFKSKKKKIQPTNTRHELTDRFYYLLLFLIPLLFFVFTTFYAIVVFLPIIIIFSVQGLIYIKNYISSFSKKLKWIFPILLLFSLMGYYLLRLEIYSKIIFWDVFLFLLVSLILFLFVFTVNNYNNLNFSRVSFDPHKLKKGVWIIALTISILASSVINVEASRFDNVNSPYPWENRYLTDEEIEIIEYLQNEDIDGVIFVSDPYISQRIGGVGFLPTFCEAVKFGLPLFYDIITPNYVYENTEFSLAALLRFTFFTFTQRDPIKELRSNIKNLDVRKGIDLEALISYNIQYIITINETYLPGGVNGWLLVRSLKQSKSFEPVFITHHLLIWKVF
ncbi:hypothetical protein ES705_08946 [subsurface metagenome]